MKRTLVLSVVLFALAACGFWFLLRGHTNPATTTAPLSLEAYKAESAHLISILNAQDPRVAIQTLKDEMAKDPALLDSCHELLHEMGRAAFKKYQSFGAAMQYQDEVCVSGYMHGIMEAYFAQTSDVYAALKTVCNGYASGTFARWECIHGVGHGLMFSTDNDLPASLKKCDAYQNPFDNGACYNGVFMENFNTDQKEHFSAFLDPTKPLYPCDQETKNLDDCYMNAPIYYLGLHPKDYTGALAMCDTAPTSTRYSCYYGVGGQATRRNVNDPLLVESICNAANASQPACMMGSVSAYLGHYVSSTLVLHMCADYNTVDRQICLEGVHDFITTYADFTPPAFP